MAGKTRIYRVATFEAKAQDHYVEATSQAAAWRHLAMRCVAKPQLPNGKEIADAITKGARVEIAQETE